MDEYLFMGIVFALWRRRVGQVLLPFGITFHQYSLVRLARRMGALNLSAAASELGMDRPTLSLIAFKCVKRGWLRRIAVIKDKRSSRLALTGQGEELLDRIDTARLFAPESIGDALDVLDSEERAALRRMLDKVSRRARDIFFV
ncbi:MAG TPA: MarR family transcriptional regulator [Rectinemataceae bacterium]|nr:MarR family transcriptional regulator [Rectinemataceae bacterium]